MSELIKNGSFDNITVDTKYGWHKPDDWRVIWDDKEFIGTLTLESVGAVYGTSNGLRLDYRCYDTDGFYDTAYGTVFPPGIYQGIDLTDQDLTNIDHLTFSLDARLDNGSKEWEFDVFIYKGFYNDSIGDYDFHYSSTFESYKFLEVFKVYASSWETFTFDIPVSNLSFLKNEIYFLGITPHVHISGVKNDNEIMNTSIIIDNASFKMIPKDLNVEDTGDIKNGSFTNWTDGMPDHWFKLNTEEIEKYSEFRISQSNEHGRRSSLLIETISNDDLYHLDKSKIAPGIYQLLDLTENRFGSLVNIEFSMRLDTINHTFLNARNYYSGFYVYKGTADSPIGDITDYVHYEELSIHSESSDWKRFSLQVVIDIPGYYYIGFTPFIEHSNASARPLFVAIDDVIAEVKPRAGTIEFGELIPESEPDRWENNSEFLSISTGVEDRRLTYVGYDLGTTYCIASYKPGALIDDVKASYDGLKQTVLSKSTSKALLNFWHNTNDSSVSKKFKVCVYETMNHIHSGTDKIIEPAIFEDFVETSKASWYNYTAVIDVSYNTRYTIVFYPYDENDNFFTLNLDKVSFFTYISNMPGYQTGEYDNPYDEDNGQLTCTADVSGTFVASYFPYYSLHAPREYFIKWSTGYYCTTGVRDNLGRHICYSNIIVQSPAGVEGSRYFFANGLMARNEVFSYQGKLYKADSVGALTECIANITGIWTNPNIEKITINTTESKTIEFLFEDQGFEMPLSIEIQNSAIATVTNIEAGSSSNKITVYGKSMGETILRVYNQNPGGSIAQKTITIKVVDFVPEDYENSTIYMAYTTNSLRVGEALAIDYFVEPDYVDLPIEWSSSDTRVATVDIYGNVLAISAGICVIEATNTYNGQVASCTIHVSSSGYLPPKSIKFSSNTVNLSVGKTQRITHRVEDSTGSVIFVKQQVLWSSSNTKVATVDKYGRITGVARGVTEIICTSAIDTSVKATVKVHVIGTSAEPQDIEFDCYKIEFNPTWNNNSVVVKHRLVPSNSTTSGVIWTSSNESAVKVSQSGTVYLNPTYKETYGTSTNFATITCKCVDKPTIYKECEVRVSIFNDKQATITSFDTELNTCVGKTLRINYNAFYHSNTVGSEKVSITTSTQNTVALGKDSNSKYINFVAKETGTFEVKLSATIGEEVINYKTFTINVLAQNAAPQLSSDLRVLYALQNDTCILRCKVEDDIDRLDDIDFYIDFGDGNGYELVYDYIEPKGTTLYQYFFISGYKLNPGTTYSTKIKAVDSYGLETVSNIVSLIIPSSSADKQGLSTAKTDYDKAMKDVLDALNYVISPSEMLIPDHYKAEFFVYYRMYCYNYDNLRDMLDKCIDSINSKISSSQKEMATLTNQLSGVVEDYEEGDYTNSNYQNITDMDYYQNECIKQLAARVLELETILNELTKNN